ncbi:MurR/RpiR family transcriptional regulator [Fictibacillus phosphorivorans]|uniref:MurR/RpiR family transcriptional regulator n=1 Tax=Fictibacillus phosphorivorans TaxID=1221500 RepID=UPI002041D531|nr:MurR/RpiR family transcriptional regulator [Fictibacillus phosphorivorans]MCM3718183.1 MurR/RpiR family transcriptional regulator [Fictibacillus phosphorivorans]MCM3775810.1 MurR/RpiR family transcriptional regulator [Fictibacillus phosphorivorans]
MLFEERVHQYEYKLNDTEDQIIEYILNNKEEATTLSIQNLASKLYTVPNTITRLTKKLGYEGFSEMKISLKEEIKTSKAAETKDQLLINMYKTIDLIDKNKFASATKAIQEARRVLFFAVGDTAPFCEMMVKNLKVIGKHGEYHSHRHDMLHEVNQLETSDVLFLISLSGETKQVLDVAKIAKKKGSRIISLTHFNKNTLQSLADINLFCFSPAQSYKDYNITDKTPVMLMVRALSEYYWNAAK